MVDQPSGVGQAKPGRGERKKRNAANCDEAMSEAASLSTAVAVRLRGSFAQAMTFSIGYASTLSGASSGI